MGCRRWSGAGRAVAYDGDEAGCAEEEGGEEEGKAAVWGRRWWRKRREEGGEGQKGGRAKLPAEQLLAARLASFCRSDSADMGVGSRRSSSRRRSRAKLDVADSSFSRIGRSVTFSARKGEGVRVLELSIHSVQRTMRERSQHNRPFYQKSAFFLFPSTSSYAFLAHDLRYS